MNITIRNARLEDAQSCAQAEQEIALTPGFLVSKPSELNVEDFKATILKSVHGKGVIYLVAEHGGIVVGHTFLAPLHRVAISHVASLHMVVHQGWQGKGIGTQLLNVLIEKARVSQHIEKIELNVRASNDRAIALYKKAGFVEEGRLKKRVKINTHQYIDDILMGLFIKNC